HFSTVVSHDVFDDGQAQAGTPGGPAPSGVHTVEPLENSFQVLLWDTDALVGDTDVGAGTGYPHGDGDPGVLGAVGDGVGPQVTQCGAEQALVPQDGDALGAAADQLDPLGVGLHAHCVEGIVHHRAQVHPRGLGHGFGPLDTGERDEVLDDRVQT